MNHDTPSWLLSAIHDLAILAQEGQLPDLQYAFSAECQRAGGLPSPSERAKEVCLLNAGDAATASEVARVAAHLFGIPKNRCQQIARDVLTADPWTILALDLIADYRSPSRLPTPQEQELWNPVTGGPAAEQYEREQRATRNGSPNPKTGRPRWASI